MQYGASPGDWTAWSNLGLVADLLPVVSDPNAVISAQSKMVGLGKTPSRFNAGGEAVGIPKWTAHTSTARDVGRWSCDSRLGICLQSRAVKGFDIDIGDPLRALAVANIIELTLGELPARGRANSGKRLLAFRLPVDFPKRIIKTEHGNIELLSTGQQFIVCGTHPSGARYDWGQGRGAPAELPELTMAEVDATWQALIAMFALPDGASEVRNGMVPTVPRMAEDLRDATVAWLDENGWVTGYQRDGRVDVRCPWEDGHSTDSGPTSTSWFPAGVGGFAMGHFRCLHASCSTRTDGDFLEATGYTASDFGVVVPLPNDKGEIEAPLPPFARDRGGRIEAELNNVLMALRRPDVIGYRVGVDLFRDCLMITKGEVWRAFDDNDYTMLRSLFSTKGFKPVSPEMMKDAVRLVAKEHQFDSAQQWADSLVWDGVERCPTFFSAFFGVEDTPYTQAVGRYTWSALAGRALEPGVKADMVPVLIGLQGVGKTTSIEAMCPIPRTYVEINLERKDDDLARSLRGKLIGEIAELRGLQGRDAESIKAWLSRRTEEWTPKYKEFATAFDRRLLFLGTGNREGFLDDDTGERRWLPMSTGAVDVPGIAANRDQLWAEGAWRFKQLGEVDWRGAYELARAEHQKYKVNDEWATVVADWLGRDDMDQAGRDCRGARPFRLLDVLVSALGFNVQKITRKEETRVGKVLRSLGYEKGSTRVDGVQAKCWKRAVSCTLPEGAENCALDEFA